MIALSWFLTIFLNAINFEAAIRILDLFFYDGSKLLFQLALQILKENHKSVMDAKDDGDTLLVLTEYTSKIVDIQGSEESSKVYISYLLTKSYRNFGQLFSNELIEKLRMKHRLKVVQNLEDSQMKNVLRSVGTDCKLDATELDALYNLMKEEYLIWRNRFPSSYTKLVDDSERPIVDTYAYSQYKIDFEIFSHFFPRLLPWSVSSLFTLRVFRAFQLLNTTNSGFLMFRDIACFFGQLLKGDPNEKITLFYRCHIPPAYSATDIEESFIENDTELGAEACEELSATSSFVQSSNQFPGNVFSTEKPAKFPCDQLFDVISKTVTEQSDIYFSSDTKSFVSITQPWRIFLEAIGLCLLQDQFIQLWKTFYELISSTSSEESSLHSLAVVGTLLLQLGEAGHLCKSTLYSKGVNEKLKEREDEERAEANSDEKM
uniref:Rab-GAP TBC domain-containing protein n=1 Tax=Syphacia muris TaxID=451379 RepID=A0A0N5A9Y3_9BILA